MTIYLALNKPTPCCHEPDAVPRPHSPTSLQTVYQLESNKDLKHRNNSQNFPFTLATNTAGYHNKKPPLLSSHFFDIINLKNSSSSTPPFPDASNSSTIATISASGILFPTCLLTLLKSSCVIMPFPSISNSLNALRSSSLGSRWRISEPAMACDVDRLNSRYTGGHSWSRGHEAGFCPWRIRSS